MRFAAGPLLPHGSAAGRRTNRRGTQHKKVKFEANDRTTWGSTGYARPRIDAAIRQGRVDLGVCAGRGLSSARGTAEAEPREMPVNLGAR